MRTLCKVNAKCSHAVQLLKLDPSRVTNMPMQNKSFATHYGTPDSPYGTTSSPVGNSKKFVPHKYSAKLHLEMATFQNTDPMSYRNQSETKMII